MNGVCIPMGGCYVDPDCENSNNEYAVIACVGTVSCGYLKHCKKTCTGTDEAEDGGAVSDPSWDEWGCTSNSDCLDDTEYCAQGTCMTNGQCNDDSDCWNPNHTGYADLRCSGYQYCNIDGYCTRNCGVQCNTDYYENEVGSECTATGCDRRSSCEGAVSCFPDRCSDDCAGIYYDAAGSVITDCIPVRTDEGSPAAGSARDELTMGNNGEEVEEDESGGNSKNTNNNINNDKKHDNNNDTDASKKSNDDSTNIGARSGKPTTASAQFMERLRGTASEAAAIKNELEPTDDINNIDDTDTATNNMNNTNRGRLVEPTTHSANFMQRLREMYDKVAEEKKNKKNNDIGVECETNSDVHNKSNIINGKRSDNKLDGYHLDQLHHHENDDDDDGIGSIVEKDIEKVRCPRPVAVPAGELIGVMKGKTFSMR